MIKLPAIQFYVADWVQDTASLSLASKGAWIDILCALHRSQTRGVLTLSMVGWARTIRSSVEQTKAVIDELVAGIICDSETLSNGDVMITNRRMKREAYERELNKQRVSGHREKRDCNENVMPYSSSSSAFASSKPRIFIPPGAIEVESYAKTIGYEVNGQKFVDYYESKGWLIGRTPMKSWKAAVRTWKHNRYGDGGSNGNGNNGARGGGDRISGYATPVPGKYAELERRAREQRGPDVDKPGSDIQKAPVQGV